ncbi:homocysteine S-methyltransferase family protein [Enhygromyxa salina]|uniref:Homocysteine S-methyltransferase n=1 Tax=Enhygromyxa salina TaxID=215803 RepID=A0A2S9XTI6_9BACT|nr:homocysteine S-methyltransferase family protein [Enhygromyxa salina]PRP96187.1 Homocysteine S-methyltransferase [Enhygromyxa salina]
MTDTLEQGPPVLLDGAMGTELAERGFELRGPLFSARALLDAPELVEQIHWDYLCAGAQVLTTNSFGLHAASLAKAGVAERQAELARRSVEVLEQVRTRARARGSDMTRFRIAGSIPPRPPGGERALARAEYRAYADGLADAGVDLLLLETFTNVDAARLALEGLAGVELPVWLSVVAGLPTPGQSAPDGTRLISGDSFEDLGQLLRSETHRVPDALLINCTQIDAVPAALDALIRASAELELPLGFSPHLGRRRYDGVWIDRIIGPKVFAAQIQAWMKVRPRLIIAGACCGSRPDYIAAMQHSLMPSEAAREQAFVRLAQLLP